MGRSYVTKARDNVTWVIKAVSDLNWWFLLIRSLTGKEITPARHRVNGQRICLIYEEGGTPYFSLKHWVK